MDFEFMIQSCFGFCFSNDTYKPLLEKKHSTSFSSENALFQTLNNLLSFHWRELALRMGLERTEIAKFGVSPGKEIEAMLKSVQQRWGKIGLTYFRDLLLQLSNKELAQQCLVHINCSPCVELFTTGKLSKFCPPCDRSTAFKINELLKDKWKTIANCCSLNDASRRNVESMKGIEIVEVLESVTRECFLIALENHIQNPTFNQFKLNDAINLLK